jgi:hypothetical protein
VPEYEVVHVHSLSKRDVRTIGGGGGGGSGSKPSDTEPPPPKKGSLQSLKLKAFGRYVQLNLQRTEGLFAGGNLKMWTAEPNSTHPQQVEYRELPQVCPVN